MQLCAPHSDSTYLGLVQCHFFSDFGELNATHTVLLLPVVCIGGEGRLEVVSNTCNPKHL